MDKAELETTPILALRWDERGLAQAVATDARTGALLMVAYINAEALERTIATGEAHYWSRSRQETWHKGGTSGHVPKEGELLVDCRSEERRGGQGCGSKVGSR